MVEDNSSSGGNHNGTTNATYTRWESKDDSISVWGLTDGKINPNKYFTKNNIAVVWAVKDKKFKTKPLALAFAKSYMRTH